MLLIENRISKVKEKYNIPLDIWEKMVSGSGSIASNQKYLEWIAKDYTNSIIQNDLYLEMLLTAVESFDRKRNNLSKKDLYTYSDYSELNQALDNLKERQRVIDTHEQSEVIYEDDRFKVVVPESHDASCYYGAGTKWCTASKNNPGHFKNYNKEGKLFYILDKRLPTSNPYYKIALNRTYKGGKSFYDAPDNLISDTTPIKYVLEHPLMDAIESFFTYSYKEEIDKISEQEKQRELERQARENEWAQRRRERIARLNAEAELRKENDEWNPENTGDPIAVRANALMLYLKEEGVWLDNSGEIESLEEEIRELRNEMENDPEVIENPNGEAAQDYGEDLNNLEEQLEEERENVPTVYDIMYEGMTHYGELPIFEYDGSEYAIGDDDEADEAADEQVRSLLEDIGYEGFSESFYTSYIDGDDVARYVEDWIRQDVEENPEYYLDYDYDRELTNYHKEQIEAIDEQLGDLVEEIEELERESDKEYVGDQIFSLEEQKEDIISDDDSYEWTEESIEQAIEDKLNEVRYDPMEYIQMYELDVTNFIDEDEFVKEVISTDGRGHGLAGYDGEEGEVVYDDEWFYIYKIG
jgi:hypothetical protein